MASGWWPESGRGALMCQVSLSTSRSQPRPAHACNSSALHPRMHNTVTVHDARFLQVYTEVRKISAKVDSHAVTLEIKALPLWWPLWAITALSHTLTYKWLYVHRGLLKKRYKALAATNIVALYASLYAIHRRMGRLGFWQSEREAQFALSSPTLATGSPKHAELQSGDQPPIRNHREGQGTKETHAHPCSPSGLIRNEKLDPSFS